MEMKVFKHFYNYFHSNNSKLLYECHSEPGHSTLYPLIEIHHGMESAWDWRYTVCTFSVVFWNFW